MQLGQKYKVVYADFSKFEKGEIVTHIKGNHWHKFRFENDKGIIDDLYATDIEIYIKAVETPNIFDGEKLNNNFDEKFNFWTSTTNRLSNGIKVTLDGSFLDESINRFPCTDEIDD